MKRLITILAACACACAWAGVASARLGSLGRNDTVVTNVTDVTPGNYETVSNRAMTASNYTDTVAEDIRQNYIPISGAVVTDVEMFLNRELHEQGQLRLELPSGSSVDSKSFVSSSQITNQGAVAAATAMAARKQDALPYPTNAIPYAAITGAPSGGGQEWRVDTQSSYNVHFVTNGMADVEMGAELSCSTNGWPNGASMFARFTIIGSGISYVVMDDRIRLVGYGTWPTNNFQSVWWRSGTNIYVNVILEE